MSDEDPLIGQVLAERFEVIRLLGGGGMGRVYEGRHRVLGKRVAIKLLHAQFATNEGVVRRFLNEARAAATLGHPNIIDAMDVGTTPSGEPFIIIEFLDGQDLKHVIVSHGALPIGRTARIITQVCGALSAAHARGITHRDIKPDNVYLIRQGGSDDFVKLLDFGISKFTEGDSALTSAGATLGTPSYMAPEQIMDASKADSRADVYATGVMLYQMLSGTLPFIGQSFVDLATKVLTQTAPPINSLRANLPPPIVQAVERAMARDLNQRMQTIDELRIALEPFTMFQDEHRNTLGSRGMDAPFVQSSQPSQATGPSLQRVTQAHGTPDVAPRPVLQRVCPSCKEKLGLDVLCPYCGVELSDPRLGQIIADRFRVDKLLGAGGMGRVYVGTHLKLQESVAIKFLLAEWTARGEFRARFKREATMLARLRHPGIVPVHDYGEHMDELYMVMEFIRGKPMRDLIHRDKAMPLPRVLHLIENLLQVIEFAHAQGVVHRDLKPENIMMLDLGDGQDRLRVLDFGLALSTDPADERITAVGAVQGTPAYMSPEQCRGRDVGPPTDIYAIGAMFFEMVCGDVPFRGNSMSDTVVQQMFVAVPRLLDRGARPDVPPAIEQLIGAALSKSPAERPTAAQMRVEIGNILRGEDPVTRAQEAAKQKAMLALASRDQRGVQPTGGATPAAPAAPAPRMTPGGANAAVAMWDLSRARIDGLQPTFGIAGVTAREWRGDAPPPAVLDGQPLKAVLIPWTPAGQKYLQTARATAHLAKIPLVVIDASDVEDAPTIIRAGATDVAYASAGPDTIFKQVTRLMKRVK